MTNKLQFCHLVKIWRASAPLSGGDYCIEYLAEEVLDCLQLAFAQDNEARSGITLLDPNPEDLKAGARVLLSFSSPKKSLGIYCKSFNEYLSHVGNKYREPANYYIHDINFFSGDDSVCKVVEKYRELIQLINLLRMAVFHFDEAQETFIFFHNGKRIFPLAYDQSVVERLDCDLLKQVLDFFQGELHQQQKLDFLSKQIAELADCNLPEKCFEETISRLGEILVKVKFLYREFSSDFSMAKFEQELQDVLLGFTKRLSDVFSSIQAQILSIPLASVIAITQVKMAKSLDRQFAANVAIMVGVLIFTLVLLGVLYNQHTSLRIIASDLSKRTNNFKERFSDYAALYEKDLRGLRDRLGLSFLAIGSLYAIAVIGFFICLIYFIVHTLPIYEALFG